MSFTLPAMPVFRCQAHRWISGIAMRLAPIPISAPARGECLPAPEHRRMEERLLVEEHHHQMEERRLRAEEHRQMEERRLRLETLIRQDRNFCAGIKLLTATDRSSSRLSIRAIMSAEPYIFTSRFASSPAQRKPLNSPRNSSSMTLSPIRSSRGLRTIQKLRVTHEIAAIVFTMRAATSCCSM